MITKKSSYSPSQRLPLSPTKAFSDKLKVGSYRSDGRAARSSMDREVATGNRNESFVTLKDTNEGSGT